MQTSLQVKAECWPAVHVTFPLIKPSLHSQYPDGQEPTTHGTVVAQLLSPCGWRSPVELQSPVCLKAMQSPLLSGSMSGWPPFAAGPGPVTGQTIVSCSE